MANPGRVIFEKRVEYPLPKRSGVRDYLFYFVGPGDGYGKGARYFFDKFYPNHARHTASSLEDLTARLHADVTERGVQQIREVVIVAHGTRAGLLFPLVEGATETNLAEYEYVTALSLACLQKDLLAGKFAAFRDRRRAVLARLKDDSWVTVRACNFGKSNPGMYALYSFFGGRANVYAPMEYQFFGTHPIMDGMRLDTKLRVHEHLVKQHYLPNDVHTPERRDAVVRAFVDPGQFSEPFVVATVAVENPDPAESVVGASRPLQPSDLTRDELGPEAGIDALDLQARAEGAVGGLQGAAAALQHALSEAGTGRLDPLRNAMLALSSFGVAGAIPLSSSGDGESDRTALLLQGRSVEAEARSRLAKVAGSDAALADASTTAAARAGLHLQRLRHVFGEAFVVLPRFRAPRADDLTRALADSPVVQGGDPFAVIAFHQRTARVRPSVAHLDELLRYAEALGGDDGLHLDVMQLPHHEGDRWVGLAATPERPLAGGRLSVVAHRGGAVDFAQPVAGLLVDEWVEVVPHATETTGVVFQSNQPDACAPHAILVAVPPDPAAAPAWTEAALAQMLHETLDLVRIRAVTPDLLPELSQYLPALYFPLNASGDTISTDLAA
jgi:hypothetical protein